MTGERAGNGAVGLAHDYLLVMRGAERTFRVIASCWPAAPIYTTLYSERGTGGAFAGRPLVTSPLQRLGVGQRGFRHLLPLYPRAVESLPVGAHDLVVSSSSAFAHGIRPRADAIHVCYCHTPFRYAWHERNRALGEVPRPLRPAMSRVLSRMQGWDLAAAGRVSRYIANSRFTAERIGELYGREAEVVYPPVEVERFGVGEPEDFLLVVGELVEHKRTYVALEAARLAGIPAVVVGSGPEEGALRNAFGSRVRFAGRVSDPELESLYSRCLALVVPNVEEFGITAVEAQAAGRPVVARDAGGARETVVDGETGVLVGGSGPRAFAEALSDVDLRSFSPRATRASAERFSAEAFRGALTAAVARASSRGG